jgi:hypothetical protein
MEDADLSARIAGNEDRFEVDSDVFFEAASASDTHRLTTPEFSLEDVSKDEMTWLYNKRFVQSTPARPLYSRLKLSAHNEKCPLCGHRNVTTLDHYMPKAKFPTLAVDPVNLIPSCGDCNKAKQDVVVTEAEKATLHPYFDEVGNDPWLVAEVIPGAPASVKFRVRPPDTWSALLCQRLRHHFRLFGLGSLYRIEAAQELSNVRFALQKLFDSAGVAAVRAHLHEQALSRRSAYLNSWQTATYSAFAESDWFVNGGFSSPG